MHFKDLSDYTYCLSRPTGEVKNVGWISRDHDFACAGCDPLVASILEKNYQALWSCQTRGYHRCESCLGALEDPSIRVGGRTCKLGSAELWVPAPSGVIFAAPDLVIHYVRAHAYSPPAPFVDAVLAFPTRVEDWDPAAVVRRIEVET